MMTYQAKAALNNYKINPDNFEWLEIEDRDDCNEIQVFQFFFMMQAREHFFRLTWSSWLGPALCREFSSEDLVLEAVMKPQLLTGLQPLWLFKIVISTLIMIISRSGKLEGMLKEAGALLWQHFGFIFGPNTAPRISSEYVVHNVVSI